MGLGSSESCVVERKPNHVTGAGTAPCTPRAWLLAPRCLSTAVRPWPSHFPSLSLSFLSWMPRSSLPTLRATLSCHWEPQSLAPKHSQGPKKTDLTGLLYGLND